MNHLELYIVLVKARTCESPGFLLGITKLYVYVETVFKTSETKSKGNMAIML
jgi:hypothetical protein